MRSDKFIQILVQAIIPMDEELSWLISLCAINQPPRSLILQKILGLYIGELRNPRAGGDEKS